MTCGAILFFGGLIVLGFMYPPLFIVYIIIIGLIKLASYY